MLIFRVKFRADNTSRKVAPSFKCGERLLTDIAIVEIFYGTPFALKLKKDITATFTDKLASIGM
jgi:hypothetical protein